MSEAGPSRKLAAILAADVAGYSRLMALDDSATVRALNESRAVFQERIEQRGGQVIDMVGDSVLAEFRSAVEAMQCAIEVQVTLQESNRQVPAEKRMLFRIGINVGDVIAQQDGTIYGDGVNIAARLESIGEPGGICVSGTVYDQVKGRLEATFEFLGEQQVKNIPEPVRAYRVRLDAQESDGGAGATARRRPSPPFAAQTLDRALLLRQLPRLCCPDPEFPPLQQPADRRPAAVPHGYNQPGAGW